MTVQQGAKPVVLIIDDEPAATETMKAFLSKDDYRLETASNGKAALARMEQGGVDVVLCDVMMPGMTGFELCQQLKADQRFKYTPLILITALDGQDDMVRGIEVGADEFLSKPVERAVLRARVRAMIRIKAQFEELKGAAPQQKSLETLIRDRVRVLADEAKLSTREREVLDLLLLGRSDGDISTVLNISARTARFHQTNLLAKLGSDSRNDLVRLFL